MQKNTTAEAAPFTRYQIFVVTIIALMQFTIVLDFMIISPLGDILKKSLNISNKEFGLVVSAYAISAAISGFFAAGFADKYDRKRMLLFFYIGFVAGTLFCGLANSYAVLLLARIVTGVFGGVIGSVGMAILADVFSLQQRGRAMSYVQMAFGGSQVLGLPLGMVIANHYNWHFTFYMIVLLAIPIGLAVIVRLKPLTSHLALQKQGSALSHLVATLKNKQYRVGFMAVALLSMGGFMIMPFTVVFLVNNVKVDAKQIPMLYFFTGLASMVIMPVMGVLSDKINRFKLFTIGSLVATAMILVYTNLPPVALWVVVTVNILLFMGIMARVVPAMALNSAMPSAADRGAYMSVSSSLQQMAGGVAAVFGGAVLIQKTPESPYENFYMLGIVMSALILFCIYLMRRVEKLIAANRATPSRPPEPALQD